MKRVLWFGTLIVLFVFVSVALLALTPQEQRKGRLIFQRANVHSLVVDACQDQKITSNEMKHVQRSVENFQKEYSEAVSIYGTDMDDKIDERIEKAVDLYYNSNPLKRGCNDQPQIKRLLSDFSGEDILTIETTFSWSFLFISLIIMCFGIILIILGKAREAEGENMMTVGVAVSTAGTAIVFVMISIMIISLIRTI